MASFHCHVVGVTKRCRLERIVRRHCGRQVAYLHVATPLSVATRRPFFTSVFGIGSCIRSSSPPHSSLAAFSSISVRPIENEPDDEAKRSDFAVTVIATVPSACRCASWLCDGPLGLDAQADSKRISEADRILRTPMTCFLARLIGVAPNTRIKPRREATSA